MASKPITIPVPKNLEDRDALEALVANVVHAGTVPVRLATETAELAIAVAIAWLDGRHNESAELADRACRKLREIRRRGDGRSLPQRPQNVDLGLPETDDRPEECVNSAAKAMKPFPPMRDPDRALDVDEPDGDRPTMAAWIVQFEAETRVATPDPVEAIAYARTVMPDRITAIKAVRDKDMF